MIKDLQRLWEPSLHWPSKHNTHKRSGGGGGGGGVVAFSSRARIFLRIFNNSFPVCAFFFFFKVEISSRKQIPLFWPGSVHSGSVSWDNCDQEFPDGLRVSSFPLRLRCAKGACLLRCNLPPALLAKWPGSFTCHCSNMGVERTPNKSQHTKLTVEKKILLPLLLGFELTIFWSRVWCSNQQAIPAPTKGVVSYCLKHFATLLCKSRDQDLTFHRRKSSHRSLNSS